MQQPANNMDDLMGLFGNGGAEPAAASDDMMNGFGGLSMGDQGASAPPAASGSKKTNEDLLSLF
jgi:hypothetical protein